MLYFDNLPNQTQSKVLREIETRGGKCDQKTYPIHPHTAERLISLGFLHYGNPIFGPRGKRYEAYGLTELARKWLDKYPDGFRCYVQGYVINGEPVIAGGLPIHQYLEHSKIELKKWYPFTLSSLWTGIIWIAAYSCRYEATDQEIEVLKKAVVDELKGIRSGEVHFFDPDIINQQEVDREIPSLHTVA